MPPLQVQFSDGLPRGILSKSAGIAEKLDSVEPEQVLSFDTPSAKLHQSGEASTKAAIEGERG